MFEILREKRAQLEMARRVLSKLEEQASGYTSLTLPASLQIQLEDKEKEVRSLQTEVTSLEDTANQNPPASDQVESIPFTNRQDEIRLILSSFGPAYFLLDAPPGYGKTDLLHELKRRYTEQNWECAYIAVQHNSTLDTIIDAIAEAFDIPRTVLGMNRRSDRLGGALREKWPTLRKDGLVFLLDLEGRPSATLLVNILQHLIPDIQNSLYVLDYFASHHNRFRSILAGRNLAVTRSNSEHTSLQPSILRLSPFNYEVIQDTVREYFVNYNETAVNQISAHLFYLTGGHPGCIAQVLKMYRDEGADPDAFIRNCYEDIWAHIIDEIVWEIREGILCSAEGLYPMLDPLSVFRYLDYATMIQLTQNQGEDDHKGLDLADKLTSIYYLKRDGFFLRDDITRRLLAIRLRHEAREEFSQHCQRAKDICAERLQYAQVQLPERWMVEYLYQSLQQHTNEIQDSAQRAAIHQNFFAKDVPTGLNLLVDKSKISKAYRLAHRNALNQIIETDWEFRFTVNYYLRKKDYNEEAIQELQKAIEAFFA